MNINLSGKTALVTGSTSGIGHAIAKGLAVSGASSGAVMVMTSCSSFEVCQLAHQSPVRSAR